VRAEAAGFESVWTIEFFNANGLVRLGAIATATQRVKLGSGIAYAFMRSPMLAASAALDIDEISGGRMILGLGSGTKTMNENWYSMPFNDPPAPRIKDAIGLIRAAFAAQGGGGLSYDGAYYKVKIPQYSRPGAARPDIPIAIAAVNRGKLAVPPPNQDEATAAKAGVMAIDDPQRQSCGNCRIDCIAAAFQGRHTGIRCERVDGGDHAFGGDCDVRGHPTVVCCHGLPQGNRSQRACSKKTQLSPRQQSGTLGKLPRHFFLVEVSKPLIPAL